VGIGWRDFEPITAEKSTASPESSLDKVMVGDRQRDKYFPDPADTKEHSWDETFDGSNDSSDEPGSPETDSRGRGQRFFGIDVCSSQ